MYQYIVLLRGINVGGKRKILMKDLKFLLEGAGFKNIQTYIQSGNIVLESSLKNTAFIEDSISKLIKTNYRFDVPTLVISKDDFLSLYDKQPFTNADIKTLHITILNKPNGTIELSKEEAIQINNLVYLHCPIGYSKTKLTNDFFEKKLKCKATTRNWNTITKLKNLLD